MEEITCIKEIIENFLAKLPLTDILVGIVVPIAAALISYYLTERTVRKKESNRIYVQIELIRRELTTQDEIINKFILYVDEMNRIEKSLEFPMIFMKEFLIKELELLQELKSSYTYIGEYIFEKPTKEYILAQKIETIEQNIFKTENNCFDLIEKEKPLKLKEEKEQYIEEFRSVKDTDIYMDLLNLQTKLENLMVGDVFSKCETQEENFVLAKYIYDKIKFFNKKTRKTEKDVLALYKDLVIFDIDKDIIKNDYFDQETFDLYYGVLSKADNTQAKLYKLCEKYYKWLVLKKSVVNYVFVFEDKCWRENSSDFVIINDREIYISLVELYESLKEDMGNNIEEKYQSCVIYHNEIQRIIKCLDKLEIKIKRKC